MQKFGYTYILTNKNMTALYCGVASNLEKRLWERPSAGDRARFLGEGDQDRGDIFADFVCEGWVEWHLVRVSE